MGSSNSGRGRGRSYGMMLIMGFGVALVGVLILHKLRERIVYSLILHHKDQHLFSLQLLLQKEREYSQQVRRTNEEMKAKMDTLRNQKLELDRRLLEMQSTIDSLKDEQKKIEVSLEEKRNEIELPRAQLVQMAREKEDNPQVAALIRSLKRKEADIAELKHRLEKPKRVWSVISDVGSSRLNSTAVNVAVTTRKVESGTERNSTEAISHNGTKLSTRAIRVLEMHENNRQAEGKGNHEEIRDNHDDGLRNMARGKGDLGGKGKRWRLIARNRKLEKNGKSTRFYREQGGEFRSGVKSNTFKRERPSISDDHHQKLQGKNQKNSPSTNDLESMKSEKEIHKGSTVLERSEQKI